MTGTQQSRREYCDEHLSFMSSDFDIAEKYFKEAKDCYINGFYKASIIMGVSALESALKVDYINFLPDLRVDLGDKEKRKKVMTNPKKRESSLYHLLNTYFSRFNRLPAHDKSIKERIVQIRNSVVHSRDDNIIDLGDEDLSLYTKRILDDVLILLNHLNKIVLSLGKCPKCQSDLTIVKAKDAKFGNRYVECDSWSCNYKKRLYPNEKPFLNNRNKTCKCGRPLVKGKTLKRTNANSKPYERCLENCDLTPVRCSDEKCNGPMKIRDGKFGIFFSCKNCKKTRS